MVDKCIQENVIELVPESWTKIRGPTLYSWSVLAIIPMSLGGNIYVYVGWEIRPL